MLTILTTIGVILIVLTLVYLFTYSSIKLDDEVDPNSRYDKPSPEFLQQLKMKPRKVILAGLVGVILLVSGSGLFFNAKSGTAYAVQYLWGSDKAVTSQGIKMKWFARTIPISFEIALQDTLGPTEDQEDIYYRPAALREFSDAIKARVATAVVVSIDYNDHEKFLKTADLNRTEGKLVHARIIPVFDQALKNTCKLMSAQDYISGRSAEFDYFLRDQLENGMYLTEEVYEKEQTSPLFDTLTNKSVVTKAAVNSGQSSKHYIIRKDANGEPLRDASNSLKKYGLTVSQAAVTFIDWEDKFDKRLDQQKEQVAATQLEKAKAEKEFYATASAIQKGEREKAEEQKKLEKEAITKVVTAQTAATEAKWKIEEENNLLLASRKAAQREKVEADARYYKNSRMVSAGLTPQEQAEWNYKTQVGVAEKLAGLKLPNYYMSGGDGGKNGQSNAIEQILMMMMAQQATSNK